MAYSLLVQHQKTQPFKNVEYNFSQNTHVTGYVVFPYKAIILHRKIESIPKLEGYFYVKKKRPTTKSSNERLEALELH